ncbi:ANTAR domain-containing protein [Noviherbaspirillum saxi]|uniref:ANTAR domain-containing protein n=1 Tax=Noviherbaspirillum saxi TaxID=2320863 RepID=UPI003B75CA83
MSLQCGIPAKTAVPCRCRAICNACRRRVALAAGREISMAVGLLMARFQSDRDTAFDVLRDHARSRRRKINEIAEDLLKAEETLNAFKQAFAERGRPKG